MKRPWIAAIGLVLLIEFAGTPGQAGNPHSAHYHWSPNRTFWFMIISDIHVGMSGTQDTEYLTWAVNDARNIVNPAFIVATGDLTDSTNGGTIPNGPYPEEWQTYRQILLDAGMDTAFYFDIPGNHDHYNDQFFEYYLAYSIQGEATGHTQHAWALSYPFGTYQFIGTCTAGNDGAPFSIWPWDNFGDNAGLDTDELNFIEAALESSPDARLSLIFGHHPFEPGYNSGLDTGLTYGLPGLLSLIDTYGISAYTFGHTHNYRENFYYSSLTGGVFYLNVSSLGDEDIDTDHFAVAAIDGDGLSVISGNKGVWPMVVITAPVDHDLGDLSQPFAYDIPAGSANPIRALVFDQNAVSQVEFRIDGGGDWFTMQPLAGSPVWQGFWDTSSETTGFHLVEVRAQGSTTVTDTITTYINPAACAGDSDKDGDVDGSNLAAFIADFVSPATQDVAGFFGRSNCAQ